jgi:hypothetical protein
MKSLSCEKTIELLAGELANGEKIEPKYADDEVEGKENLSDKQ